jgi:hypothetical protein
MHIGFWNGIGTKRGSFSITVLLTCDIPFIFYDDIAIDRELTTSTSNSVIAAANDVEMANDVEIPTTFRSTIDRRSEKMLTSRRQDQHLIDTDKFECCHWFINGLFFISLKFLLSLKNGLLVYWIWEYRNSKIGLNFLPGLVSSNLNADLNLSVLRKKAISKLKFYEHMILF